MMYGRVDIVNTKTGEIWEVKPSNWSHKLAKEQLNNYAKGKFLNKALPERIVVYNQATSNMKYQLSGSFPYYVYDVEYWYAGDGIINYSYEINTQRLQEEAVKLGITVVTLLAMLAQAFGIPVPVPAQ